jgi:regulator of replication initiation timing
MNHEKFQKELNKLRELFKDIEPSKAALADGLLEEAAFLKVQNDTLRASLAATGMVKVHPCYPEIQKPIIAAGQYLKNANSYAVIIKALNGILQKNTVAGEDEFDAFLKEDR